MARNAEKKQLARNEEQVEKSLLRLCDAPRSR
jgi:hypothetical protein